MGGGIMPRHYPQEPILIYIGVDSVAEYSKKVEDLGGKVTRPKTEVPGHGGFAVCTDTENNAFALWEPTFRVPDFISVYPAFGVAKSF